MLVVLLGRTELSEAVHCDFDKRGMCSDEMTSNVPPTALCCSKLKQQKHCLCHYIKDPVFGKTINSPNSMKMFASCQIMFQVPGAAALRS
ncbi:hypothetical protein TIFTF001_007875 [Ficus carica]|uniref:Bifunctional inhibitor/plant lipid transfer protein/seed storage helical domain-containing protein n=1 Tax=Ficus carica TaxID=3494 RepID=A0AA88D020_FICCA|nr:hypothetical protein TIFTF001_007875 [Ficus carica]